MGQAPCYVYAQAERQHPQPTFLLTHLGWRYTHVLKAKDATVMGGNLPKVTQQGQGQDKRLSPLASS